MVNVVGLFGTDQDAECALSKLDQNGFSKDNIDMVAVEQDTGEADTASTSRRAVDDPEGHKPNEDVSDPSAPAVGFVPAASPQGMAGMPNSQTSGIFATQFVPVPNRAINLRARLADMGLKEEERDYFANAARRGGTIIVVKADKERTNVVAGIMRDCNGVTQDRYNAEKQ